MNHKLREFVLGVASMLNRNVDGKIFFYHDVYKLSRYYNHATPLELLVAQVQAARRAGFSPVRGVPTTARTFQLCFDDGYAGVFECQEELVKLGVLPTIYLAPSLCGTLGYLNREQIVHLHNNGFIFESHTWSHSWLPSCDDEKLERELVDSKKWIEDLIGGQVRQLCFPRGLFSRRVYERALEVGYEELVSSIPGSVNQVIMPKVLPREIVQDYSPREFVFALQGAMRMFSLRYFKRHYQE